MIAPARWAAFEALTAIAAGADLAETLARSRDRLADERDRALAAAIVIGTLRWRARLDHLLAQASARPLSSLDPAVLEILRLSLFQLLFLERVPASAVVDDAVSMTRRARKSSAGGFVNGVLRGLSRRRETVTLPDPPPEVDTAAAHDAAAHALAVTESHPEWLVARWLDRLGPETTRQWLAFDNIEASLTLRANLRRQPVAVLQALLAEHGVETVPARFAPAGLVVTAGNPLKTPLADSGRFLVQDEASQLVPLALGVRPGERVLDTCAAPGGKTLAIADALGDGGLLVAADLRPRRMTVLRRLLTLHGVRAALVVHDLAAGGPFGPVFDRVLVDAPCTGLGTLRRDVDIRWRREPAEVARAGLRQLAMLQAAAGVVKPGGRLVYATCSSEPEENAVVVEAFLSSRQDFRPLARPALLADGMPEAVVDSMGHLVTRPDKHGLEAFFAAPLERVA